MFAIIPAQIDMYRYEPVCQVQTASSVAGAFLYDSLNEIREENQIPYVFQTTEQRFESLVTTWNDNVIFSSSLNQIVSDPAYLQVIAMGPKVLPLIFKQMQSSEPDHWFVALASITGGVNPVKKENLGNMRKMADDWLAWASDNSIYAS